MCSSIVLAEKLALRLLLGLGFLSRLGKTGYFSSGSGPPRILSEKERARRLEERRRAAKRNGRKAGRRDDALSIVPELAHAGNFAPPQDDPDGEHCHRIVNTKYY